MQRGKSLRLSLAQRISILTAIMALLTLAAAGSGLWFSTIANRNIQLLRQSADQATLIADVERAWLGVVSSLNAFTLTRPSPEAKQELEIRLRALEARLSVLSAQPLGTSPEKVAENRQIAGELRQTYAELQDLSDEIYALAEQGRWGAALQRRTSGLTGLQTQLEGQLNHIRANLQADLEARNLQTLRAQNAARLLSGLSVAVAFMLALGVGWLGQRVISRPMGELTRQLERITQGDFSPVAPMPRRDEIGDLSHSIARMTDLLRENRQELENRVHERTQALERRTIQVQIAAQVARDIAAARNLAQLLDNAVNLIRERLGYYHAGVFLIDARGEYAVLRAATGEAGREMLSRNHSLRVGQTGLVGYAAHRGEARVAADVGADLMHYKNPLLPETRSEAAIPMNVAGRVIGVLDVQSRDPDAFDSESLGILQVLADQLAIAIQNARLISDLQKNLSDMQQTYGQIEREAWLRFIQTTPILGYTYDGVEVRPLQAHETSPTESDGHRKPFSIPLRVRNEVIGSLDIWPQEGEPSEAEVYLLASISNRLSQILESARLYEETRSWAAREETINRLTASIARALDLDSLLRTSAQELGKLPAVREATIIVNPRLSDNANAPTSASSIEAPQEDGKESGNGHRS
ncbi:MAG: GAF domain-containing protein [Anaerolineales bacterium]|nr:GAF domain-containing protein [Anaerolineales bacterium]